MQSITARWHFAAQTRRRYRSHRQSLKKKQEGISKSVDSLYVSRACARLPAGALQRAPDASQPAFARWCRRTPSQPKPELKAEKPKLTAEQKRIKQEARRKYLADKKHFLEQYEEDLQKRRMNVARMKSEALRESGANRANTPRMSRRDLLGL